MDLIKGTGTMSESTMVSHVFCNHLYGLVFDIVILFCMDWCKGLTLRGKGSNESRGPYLK